MPRVKICTGQMKVKLGHSFILVFLPSGVTREDINLRALFAYQQSTNKNIISNRDTLLDFSRTYNYVANLYKGPATIIFLKISVTIMMPRSAKIEAL